LSAQRQQLISLARSLTYFIYYNRALVTLTTELWNSQTPRRWCRDWIHHRSLW
jgi:hypothetical protein